ncbi:hypothetical protein [Rhodobacter sp. NSM]|uniref:hypothetical protein n=1 Tax=Rhodobacter sp. NSM TaxID=3457501 RepID=UPI003FD0EA80
MNIPTTIPAQNNHRVIHFSGDAPRPDFERLEELAADGVAAARRAMALVALLPTHLFNPLQEQLKMLSPHIRRRRLLSERAWEELQLFVGELVRLQPQGPDEGAEPVAEIGRLMRDALDASHRVADLVAAEREIAWLRGVREVE